MIALFVGIYVGLQFNLPGRFVLPTVLTPRSRP
jgi:hypothetical protein